MRRFLLLIVAVSACQFSLAQAQPPVGATFLASDGNLYGINPSGQFFSYSPSTGQTNIITSAVNLTLCLERSDGTLLAINYPSANQQQFIKLSLTGQITPIVQAPSQNDFLLCPALASDGNYYGSAAGGGAYGDGYLYQLTAAGKMNVFYNFTGKADGSGPTSTPVEGSDGNLYFFPGSGLLRYSATAGLAIFPTQFPVGPSTPLEASDGNFYGIGDTANGSAVAQVQPTGATTSIYAPPYESAEGPQLAGLFISGNGLAVLTPIGGENDFCFAPGDYYNMDTIELQGDVGSVLFAIGSGGDYLSTYTPTLYQGGDGSFFGTVNSTTVVPNSQGYCTPDSSMYGVDYPTTAVPIQMTLNKTHVLSGGSAQLTWQVNNAFSKTMQQCYGYGALAGKVALSGSTTVSAPEAGSYVTSIVCGGTETGLATLTAGNAQVNLTYSANLPFPSYPIAVGTPVTLTATITNAGNDAPTGNVEFLYGSRLLGSAPLVNGVATFTASTNGIPPGTYNVVASYPGDANYGAAKSPAVPITLIARPAPTLVLTPATQSVIAGSQVNLTVTANGQSSFSYPSGPVSLLYGSRVLATVTLDQQNTNVSFANFNESSSGLPLGTYHVIASYGGDTYNAPATSAPVTVTLVAQTVTVSASPNPVPSGSSFSVTAKVQGSPTPTGTVTFSASGTTLGSTSLNSSGMATINLPTGTLTPGTYQLTAYYAGDSHNPAATSPAITLTIN